MKKSAVLILMATGGMLFAEEPDAFTWCGGASGDWMTSGNWTPAATERVYPGIVGDEVVILGGSTVSLGGAVTVSRLQLGDSNSSGHLFGGDTAGTLTLRSSDGVSNFPFNLHKGCNIGSADAPDNLVLNLASPVVIRGNKGGAETNRGVIRAKVTGGTDENPCPVQFTKSDASYNHGVFLLVNANNDFRGDVYLRGISYQENCTQTLGLGLNTITATDSMLGDPANEIYFEYIDPTYDSGVAAAGQTRLFVNNIDADGLKRKVHGQGTVRGRKYDASYKDTADTALVLGDGFVSDPCVYRVDKTTLVRAQSSIYGNQIFAGTSVTLHDNATFVFDVDVVKDVNKQDTVTFSPITSAFTLNGKIVVREGQDLPVGTVFEVGTVAAAAGSCTISPSSITPGWECSATGDSTSGWTIRLVKSSSAVTVQSAGVSELGSSRATVSANVLSMGSTAEGTLKFYYGKADGGDSAEGWASSVEYGTVSAAGAYSVDLTGLDLATYYVRPAVEANGIVSFAPDSIVFTTVPDTTPSAFVWNNSENDADWATDGVWDRETLDYARLLPGCAGDRLVFDLVTDYSTRGLATTNISMRAQNDLVCGKITVKGGYGRAISILPDDDTKIVFDNNGSPVRFEMTGQLASANLGTSEVPGVIELADPLVFYRSSTYNMTLNVYSKVTGGTSADKRGLKFETSGDQYLKVKYTLVNSANDFVGDITLTRGGNGECTLFVGSKDAPAENAMLGDAANELYLNHGAVVTYYGTSTITPTCTRHIHGNGTINAIRYQDQWNSPGVGISLGVGCELSPGGDNGVGFGTIKVSGPSVADVSDVVYRIDIDADDSTACDAVNFAAKSALTVNGSFAITPDDPAVKIAPGTRWAIGTIDKTAGAVAQSRFACVTPEFKVVCEGDAETGWTLYAERKQSGMSVIFR